MLFNETDRATLNGSLRLIYSCKDSRGRPGIAIVLKKRGDHFETRAAQRWDRHCKLAQSQVIKLNFFFTGCPKRGVHRWHDIFSCRQNKCHAISKYLLSAPAPRPCRVAARHAVTALRVTAYSESVAARHALTALRVTDYSESVAARHAVTAL